MKKINLEAYADLPVGVLMESLAIAGMRIVQDGKFGFYLVKRGGK